MTRTERLAWSKTATPEEWAHAVATVVMGWRLNPYNSWTDDKGMVRFAGIHRREGFTPSEEIADAWQVLFQMKSRLFTVRQQFLRELESVVREKEKVQIAWPDLLLWIEPCDICLAALLTVEDEHGRG